MLYSSCDELINSERIMPSARRFATQSQILRSILFVSDHLMSAFGLTILKNAHPEMRRIRRQFGSPAIHGNKFWKSSYLLMDYLSEFPLKKKLNVLELGCGYGLAGIFCAKKFSASVTSLDADDAVFPYVDLHAELNGVQVEKWKSRYEKVRVSDLERFDLVIGADICFWDSMSEALFNLIRRAKRAGDTRVIFADPGRSPFRSMAEKTCEKTDAEYTDWFVHHPHNASGLILDV